jgi:hypothetical protein
VPDEQFTATIAAGDDTAVVKLKVAGNVIGAAVTVQDEPMTKLMGMFTGGVVTADVSPVLATSNPAPTNSVLRCFIAISFHEIERYSFYRNVIVVFKML